MKQEPNTLAVHLADALGAARCEYRRQLKRCHKKFSGKTVHNLRVETRRLLALLDVLEAAAFNVSPEKVRKVLKKRFDAFDDLRDTHVQLQLLKPMWTKFPEARPLKKFLRRHERRLIKNARDQTADTRWRKLSERLKELEKGISASAFIESENVALNVLRKWFARVGELRAKIRPRDSAAIHEMRIAFKRFRYASELLRPFAAWLNDNELKRMRKFQADAGVIQDFEILMARLDRLVEDEKIPAPALKRLRAELVRKQRSALAFFLKRVDDLARFNPDRAGNKTATGRTQQK